MFFYLVENIFMSLTLPDSSFTDHSPTQLRNHFKAILHDSEGSKYTAEAARYEDFPEDPRKMSKEDKLRIEMQNEKDPHRREQKRKKFIEYRKWKREEMKRRAVS